MCIRDRPGACQADGSDGWYSYDELAKELIPWLLDLAGANATVELPSQRVKAAADKEMAKLRSNLTRSGLTMDCLLYTSF